MATLDPAKCWYVEAATSKKNPRYKIASFKQRLNRVLPWMTPNQRLMEGISTHVHGSFLPYYGENIKKSLDIVYTL